MPTIMQPAPQPSGVSYATINDLVNYTGLNETLLPTDASRLLVRASKLIKSYTLNRAVSTNTVHMDACRDATCAQVEYWIENGEDKDVSGPIQGYTTGKVQVQFGAGNNRLAPLYLAPRAKRELQDSGLLYCGASVSRGGINGT